ncbi:MAG TPA: germination protein YpeB [Candidatus Eubacterium faecipullorum]|uniref:Germination protein YpeB n=1 Tax=Candidatus Eubacterium faecipullorum TaxID=2838571 RepID=A0A9D1RCY5_9FIRM|nr:germination protein YpeB [Candidatus Eubacterium faecipullorum]
MKRRNIVRICSFAFCAVAALAAFAIMGNIKSNSYQTRLEAAYQRNLMQLSECLDSIETSLSKSQYATSSEMMNKISGDLYSECCTAKNALSSLPISQLNLTGAYKFLSQAGDYARYLSAKEQVTQEEYDNLALLLTYAQKYSDFADTIVSRCNAGGSITDNEVALESSDLKVSSFSADFSSAEETFEGYPTLLYDGPFADAVLNKESAMIKSAEKKDQDECRKIAAAALGVDEGGVVYKTEESGTLPAYVFSYKLYTIAVTKNGGYIAYILNEGTPSEQAITEDNAINVAKDYLNKIGYSDMKESYYTVYNNVCTINFAYCKDNITYYSDLIKVGVSLSDGNIFSLEADGYLVNHTEREVQGFAAEQNGVELNSNVEILSASRCLIPKSSGVEVFCNEYHCKNKSTGQEVLIYTDSETGEEEDILLLMYSDNGTLTK